MSREAVRLTAYFGERSRAGDGFLADRLISVFGQRRLAAAVLLRGGEGFGARHGLQADSLLTLSEDLPMVAIAVGSIADVRDAVGEVLGFFDEGLLTVEPAWLTEGGSGAPGRPSGPGGDRNPGYNRLTVWTGRHSTIGSSPAYRELAGVFKRHGAEAAVVLLGLDGVIGGRRHRAGFFSANRQVPLLVTGVGREEAIAGAAREISRLLPDAIQELREIWLPEDLPVRAGAIPDAIAPDPDVARLGPADRISVYGGGLDPEAGIRQQELIVRRLRRVAAPGATALQAEFGFRHPEDVHGESFWSLRRRIPVVTETVDSPQQTLPRLDQIARINRGSALVIVEPAGVLSRPGVRA